MIILEFRYSCDFQFEFISVYSSALGDKKILNEFLRTTFPKNVSKSVKSTPFDSKKTFQKFWNSGIWRTRVGNE